MTEFLVSDNIVSGNATKLLYVDILNYGVDIFPLKSAWKVTKAFRYVKSFVDAAKISGYELKVFIDDSIPTEETSAKWHTRRAQEIMKGQRNMPLGLSMIIGDMFKILSVPVVFSDADLGNDDNLAAHAEADGASVLSNDKDFFRYVGSHFRVYGNYEIRRGRLYLKEKFAEDVRNPSSLMRIPPKPCTVKTHPSHVTMGVYKRGAATPLVRALNFDLQSILTPLRRASFVRSGIKGPFSEVWPYWDAANECVAWHEEHDIAPTSTPEMLALLDKPDEAVDFFFPDLQHSPKPVDIDNRDWVKHLFCIRSLIYEFCSTEACPLLMLWLEYERKAQVQASGEGSGKSSGQNSGRGVGRGDVEVNGGSGRGRGGHDGRSGSRHSTARGRGRFEGSRSDMDTWRKVKPI